MPLLIMVMGLPGTGKSTLAKLLTQKIPNSVLCSSLQVKRDLGYQRFSDRRKDRIYFELKQRINEGLANKKNVIIDRGICRAAARQEMLELVFLYHYQAFILECLCSVKTAERRIRQRIKKDKLINDPTDPRVHRRIAKIWEPIKVSRRRKNYPPVAYLQVNTEKPSIAEVVVPAKLSRPAKQIEKIIQDYWQG
ncbi:MAG: ATP-binding protein [Patescibacteria group bacterium]|jgi:predicted kinase